mmetsp:Transcript_98089/g.245815  ORF Transcript_98089/g.245815 Transcript_98089/m.245815 type:complete len:318 (-) Transcript_98089:300-1253(-)
MALRSARGAPALGPQGPRRQPRSLVLRACLAAVLAAAASELTLFVVGGVSSASAAQRRLGRAGPRHGIQLNATPLDLDVDAGIQGVANSSPSLGATLLIFLISLPGVQSTIQREGQAKFIEKVYLMQGPSVGGLEMRSIAGGIFAYFKTLNYSMGDAPAEGRIRFVGNLQGSLSQAMYLSGCLLGALASCAFIASSLVPDGPFGLGVNLWFAPCLFSPGAGVYYWQRAFRKDIVELQLETSDDQTETTLTVLGDKATVEEMQKGVRFQSASGKLFQLMEKDMEYVPGIFDDGGSSSMVWKEKDSDREVKAEPMAKVA